MSKRHKPSRKWRVRCNSEPQFRYIPKQRHQLASSWCYNTARWFVTAPALKRQSRIWGDWFRYRPNFNWPLNSKSTLLEGAMSWILQLQWDYIFIKKRKKERDVFQIESFNTENGFNKSVVANGYRSGCGFYRDYRCYCSLTGYLVRDLSIIDKQKRIAFFSWLL